MASARENHYVDAGSRRPEQLQMSNDNARGDNMQRLAKKTPVKRDPIADALRKIHDSIAEEPTPSSFLDLVAEIEAKIDRSRS